MGHALKNISPRISSGRSSTLCSGSSALLLSTSDTGTHHHVLIRSCLDLVVQDDDNNWGTVGSEQGGTEHGLPFYRDEIRSKWMN